MILTRQWFIERHACEAGIAWWEWKGCPSLSDAFRFVHEVPEYARWLIEHTLDKRQAVKVAIFAARLVSHHNNDPVVEAAIVSAENWIADPCAETEAADVARTAARTAARAAAEAAEAAEVAWATASGSAETARAARATAGAVRAAHATAAAALATNATIAAARTADAAAWAAASAAWSVPRAVAWQEICEYAATIVEEEI
jgi:hypothetical protein